MPPLLALIATALIVSILPALGQRSTESSTESQSEFPRLADKALRGLELSSDSVASRIRQLPSYALPEIPPNGDIAVRRRDPQPPPEPPPRPQRSVPDGGTRL